MYENMGLDQTNNGGVGKFWSQLFELIDHNIYKLIKINVINFDK